MGGVVSSIFGGSNSSQQSQSQSGPVDVTPPAFAALQSPLANTLMSYFSGGPTYGGLSSVGAPLSTSPTTTTPSTFAASLTPTETSLLGTLMSVGGQPTPAMTSANSYVNSVLQPGYLQSVLNSPAVSQAIQAAVTPLVNTYQNTTMPNLRGQFAANGAVLNGPNQVGPGATAAGSGSSPFDRAAALSQQGLEQSIASATAPIEQAALQLGVGQQEQAATQAAQLSATDINNLISTLQAEALPRLIQQYGMDQGLQEFNNRVNVMLEALGLAAQKAGPDIAQQSTSSGEGSSTSGAFGGGILGNTSLLTPFFSAVGNLFSSGPTVAPMTLAELGG